MHPGTLGFLALVAAVGAAVSMSSVLGWAPPLWVEVSVALREGSALAGVVTCVVAAWVAADVRPPGILGGQCRARTGLPTAVRHVSRMLTAVLGGTAVVVVPALVITAVRATAGRPNLTGIADGFAVVAFWVALGYFVGTVAPQRWSLPLAAVVSIALWVIPQEFRSVALYSVVPVWSLGWPYLGDVLVPSTAVFRVVFFAALSTSLVLAAARWADRGRTRALLDGVRAGALLLPVTMLAVVAVVQQPPLVTGEDNPPIVCDTDGMATVCMHKGFARLLGPAVDAVTSVARASGRHEPLLVIEQSASLTVGDADVTVFRTERSDARAVGDQWATETALALAGWPQCSAHGTGANGLTTGAALDYPVAADTVAAVLARRAGHGYLSPQQTSQGSAIDPQLETRLQALSEDEFADWFSRNGDLIAACMLPLTIDTTP